MLHRALIGSIYNTFFTSIVSSLSNSRPSLLYMNSECVLESRDTPTAGNNLIPISVASLFNVCV